MTVPIDRIANTAPAVSTETPFRRRFRFLFSLLGLAALACGSSLTETADAQNIAHGYLYTGSTDTFVVPSNVTSLTVQLWGAGGGGSVGSFGVGGSGAYVMGKLSVTPGETLTVLVGGGGKGFTNLGIRYPGGYGGGGAGFGYSGGGGGRSAILRGSVELVDVGGGGGGATVAGGGSGGITEGRAGGVLAGGPDAAGKGGTQSMGGAGGICPNPQFNGQPGGPFYGGGGAGVGAGGGGGGGYFGGGGGSINVYRATGGGGGGSSLVANLTEVDATSERYGFFYVPGVGASGRPYGGPQYSSNGGDGEVVISYNIGFTAPTPTVTRMTPNVSPATAQSLPISLSGTNFQPNSVVNWNGVPLTSSVYVSPTQIDAVLPAGYVSAAGSATVTVTTPAPGGGTSNSLVFLIGQANVRASLLSLTRGVGGVLVATFTVTNAGSVPATGVAIGGGVLTDPGYPTLSAASGAPAALGALAQSGGSTTTTLTFAATLAMTGTSAKLKLAGSFDGGGSFLATIPVTIP